jgi:hypothetical protein
LPWISLYTLSEMKDISSIDKMKGKEKGWWALWELFWAIRSYLWLSVTSSVSGCVKEGTILTMVNT